jgi:hypothetical protein
MILGYCKGFKFLRDLPEITPHQVVRKMKGGTILKVLS